MSLGGPEILVIIVIALLVLGPDKLPGAMRTLGKGYAEVKKFQNLAKTEIDKAMAMAEDEEANIHKNVTDEKPKNISTGDSVAISNDPPVIPSEAEESIPEIVDHSLPVKPIIDKEISES